MVTTIKEYAWVKYTNTPPHSWSEALWLTLYWLSGGYKNV